MTEAHKIYIGKTGQKEYNEPERWLARNEGHLLTLFHGTSSATPLKLHRRIHFAKTPSARILVVSIRSREPSDVVSIGDSFVYA